MDAEELRARVAANIRDLAEAKGIGLNALADLSGLSRAGFHFIVTAKKSATLDSLATIASALGVDASRLLHIRDEV